MNHDIYSVRYGLGEVIRSGWQQYCSHFKTIVPILLAVYVPINIGLSFVPVDQLVEDRGLQGVRLYLRLIQLTEFLIGMLATIAIAYVIERSVADESVGWSAALRHAIGRWGAGIGTGLLGGLIIFGMFLLLIVPGIIWGLYYTLYIFVVALRGRSGKEALDYSKSIVKGQWWRVLGYLFSIELLVGLATVLLTAPTWFLPDIRVLNIATDTLVDIIASVSTCMTVVFFLNNDRIYMRERCPNIPDR